MQLSKMDVHDFTQLLCEIRDTEESERQERMTRQKQAERKEGGAVFALLICEPGLVFRLWFSYNDSNNT